MAKKWNDVVNNPEYQKLSAEQQEAARNEYFEFVVKPNIPDEDLSKARAEFDDFSTTSTGESIANVYKAGITGLKDLGTNVLTAPLRTGKAIIDSVDSRSVTNNSDRSLDGTTPEATGFDQSAGGRVLDELTTKQPDTLKAGSRIVDGAAGIAEVGLRKGYAGIGRIEAGALSLASDITGSETLKQLSDDQLKRADEVENAAVLRGKKSTAFEPDSIVQDAPRVATNAIGSTITSAPAILAGAATGGGALPAIFATSALSDYGTSGDDLSTGGKVAHAIGTGAAETLGEKLGGTDKFADALTKVLGGKNALAELGVRLLASGAKEVPSEEVTTTAQFLLDKNKLFGLNQDATLDDYIEQVKETAKVAAMQGAGMTGAGGVIKAVSQIGDKPDNAENDAEAAKQSALNAWKTKGLTISQGNPADDALAAQKQAEYDAAEAAITAQKAEKFKTLPDQNLENLRRTAQTLNPADVPVIDAEIERRASLGTLTRAAEIAQEVDPLAAQPVLPAIPVNNEAINAADILEADNVSDLPSDAATSVVTEATQATGDNVQGSVGNIPDQYAGRNDTGRIDNVTETPTQSSGSDQPTGNRTQGNDAVAILNGEDAAARPFAQATDDFLPQMRSMTTDETIIKQIDDELALRKIAPVTTTEQAAGTTTVPVADAPKADSWVIRNKETGEPIMETFQKSVADKTNTDKYEVVPILQHLQELNQEGSKASNYAQSNTSSKSNAQTKAPEPFMRNESQEQSLSNAQEAMVGDMQNVAAPSETPVAEQAQKVTKAAKPKAIKPKTLLATLRDLGGVAITEKRDITGEVRGFAAGGYNQIFKSNSKRSMKGLIESGDLDEYLPYNMRLESNGANDEAFDSTEAYDYLADKIRNGESVLPYAVEEELRALQYEGNAVNDVADELTEDEINEQLSQASNEERESTTNARVFNTDSENSSTESSAGRETNAQPSQASQDLLGEDTRAKQALADAERTKDAKRNAGTDNPEAFTLTGSTSEADQAAAAGAQDLFAAPKAETKVSDSLAEKLQNKAKEMTEKADRMESAGGNKQVIESLRAQAERDLTASGKSTPDTQKSKDDTRFANNKVFTADKVAAARARLKSKLNTLNSGIDPELLIDGMTIAGAYIETGVRKFSDYAKAMTDDFGDSIKPYLLSFYEAARAYPSIDKEGMTDAESAAKEHQALLTPAVLEQAKEVIGQGVVESPKAKAKPNGQIKLTQDWGVDSIDGYAESDKYPDDNSRENTPSGVKLAFLAEGKKYLTQVSKLLEAEGWEAHKDRRGRTEKTVNVNEAGHAVSGEVTLTMRKGNAGVYVDLGTSAIRGLTGNHPQGVSVLIRATDNADTDKYATKGQNIWLSTDLRSTELANKLVQTAERYVKNTIQAEEGEQNARATTAEQVPDGSTQSDLLTEQPRSGNSKPMDSGLAAESNDTSGQGRVSSGVSETSGNRAPSTSGSDRTESPSGSRKTSDAGNTASAANDLNDFEITDETGIGEGSIAQKYKDNITAIKLIKTLESEGRIATPEERNQLAKYNGFGALSKVFEKNNPKYQELKDLLTESEYEAAKASILNAYYTSPTIVKAMYDAVAHMGFKGGRILEPSLGSGNFFGMMPAAMRNKSKLNGVELDILTSRLAKYLYPNANIAVATGFEEYKAPQGYFDLVISNPPFGSERLRDNEKAEYSGFSIHNFFIAKSIDKLRNDGLLAVVVSHNFMDAMDSKAREWISKRAVLRGAVRLPNTAFKDNAGTEVITDILFFQKTNMPEQNPDWVTAKNDGDYSFNEYFYANPMNVLGRVEDITNQYGNTYTVAPTGDTAKLIKEFITARLMADVYVEPEQRIEVLDSADNTVPDSVKVGTFYTDDKGVVRQRLPDLLGAKRSSAWEAPNAKAQERMLGMMALRDLLRSQMRLERDPMATEKEIERNRERMNKRYDEYLKKHGYLNNTTNRRLFLDDTESALLQALEIDYDQGVSAAKATATGMDEKPASAQKADIFTRRVLFPPSDSITVNNAKDALLASLNVKGVVDADYMAEVYSKSKAEIIDELGDVVYNDPNRGYVTADEYLSGDVKTKLAEAKFYAKDNAEFKRNVEALEKVIPKDKMPSEIYASAGANWIPADVYADFANEITGIPKDSLEFKYISAAATWLSEKTRGGDAGKMTSDYGTPEVNSFDIFALLINGKAPEVREMVGYGQDRRSVVNIEKTEAARSKLEKVKEAWNSWVFKDADRADRLATIYNEKHNRIVARKFDGSHMQFAGMTPVMNGKPFSGLRQHQKDVVWRAIQDRNVLLDHVVGAGKTMAAAAIAMEMKRLGIARKPLFVVPNHLTLQWRSEFTKLYPASNILAATPEDFAKDKREKLFSKMVTGNYDAIIIGHSSLTKIGLPADVEAKMYDEQVKEIADAIEAAKTERGDRGITRDMEKIKANLEAKIKKLKEKAGVKDNVVSFDELGIDAMIVDEMHEFKNLFFTTQMQRTAGLGNPSGSGKALDLFMKIKFMTDTYGEDVPLITMTGTPVSNSLAEMFTMQRFMKYKQMKRQDLHLFDAWAKQFGEVENVYEVAPSGVGYRQGTRFSKFKNLPALMGSYTSFADIITMQDLKDQTAAQIDPETGKPKVFPVPKLKTGKPINVIAQRSELQRDFFGVPQLATNEKTGEIEFELDPENTIIEQNSEGKYQIIEQVKDENGDVSGRKSIGNSFDTKEEAELELVTKSLSPKTFIDPESLLGKFANLATLTRESKGKINALSLTGLASKSGLDYRIIDPSAPDFEGSKINQAVTNMVSLWKETAQDKGTQLVFCDLSIPNSARNDMSSKERRIYVRDREGELTHKAKGIVYAPEGYEGFPFYITKGRNGFDVYEAVTGTLVRDYGLTDKAAAKAWAASYVELESNRDRVFVMRDTKTIDQSDIEEYRDAKELEVADDGSNEISTADLEAVAGSSKFSVYDDIRAKLIKSGVPENQIAFIHDYNTPKQKEELFKRVNSGDVRFLFGSTPKLGAGTNVQKRLVGLHHIDAPWRPSDLEQREGRIIRQGNDLYTRDPENFEISIWRYATEQTYDTRRWQLLEHKAAGIEQLRKYSGESEIEDVASEASNSADMKAAASGNPLILEETKLRTDVKRLINLEKAHADSQYSMARKVRDNTNYVNDYLPKKIAEYQKMQDAVKAYQIPEDKNKVASLKVDGKVVNTREAAENAIADLALKTRSLVTMGESDKVIQSRGIEFTVNRGSFLNSMILRSPDGVMHTYTDKEGVSPSGLITRFNNYIDSFEARIEDANRAIASAKAEIESLSKRLNEPFEYSAKLKETQAEHANVQRRLMKSSALESVPDEQRPEYDRLVKERKETLKDLGFEKALKESEIDTPVFSIGNGSNKGMPKQSVQAVVNTLRKNWKNAPEIIVVENMDDPAIRKAVRDEDARLTLQGSTSKPIAFYDAGKVYILSSQVNTAKDVQIALFHEALGHHGLRHVFGKDLAAILDSLVLMRTKDVIAKAKQYGLKVSSKADLKIAAEEVLAEMAQNNPQIGFVKRAIAAIRKFLRSIGVNLELSDNDIIANFILPARNFVVKGGKPESFSGLVPAMMNDSNVSFSRTPDPMQSRLTPQWETLEDSTWSENLIRTLQDKNIDLKRVTESIKEAGVNLSDRWNAYLQEELYHGRAAKRVKDFMDFELTPLIDDMRARKVSMADLQQYLWNRHAEERNIQVAKVNPDMPDGGSGINTQDAKDYLAALTTEQKADFKALAARIDAINKGSRQTLVDYGLESAGTILAWNNAYEHYVPLKRDEMDLGFGMGTGQGFSVKGNATKRAMGSSKEVVDIIANIAQQREQYIIRGEKNRVATALVGLAKTNPNEDFWQIDNPPRIRMISKSTGLVEEYTDPTYKNHPNVIVARIVNKRGEVEERSVQFNRSNERAMQLAASMKNLDVDQMEHWLRNWVAPITRYFASVNTQYNPIFGMLNITRDVQGALLNLSTTPIAGKQKDVLINTGKAMAGIYKDMRLVRAGKGTVATQWSTLWEEFQREGGKTGYRDMFANAAERSEAIEKSLDPTWWTKTRLGKIASANGLLTVPEEMLKDKVVKPIFNWLSDYNETLENSVRLAVYKVALDNGQTKQQAASIAKNISVNFNRKGSMGQNLGALYAFFNASVQGTARIGETLTGKRGQQIIAGGLLFGAMQAVAIVLAGFGDDEPPEFVRDRNIIIPLGDKRYGTIPMPLGYNAIPNLGRILTEWAMSGFDKTGDRFTHILSMSAEVFNPIGGNGSIMSIVTPTALDPINDLSQNEDWTGRQISREDINKNAQTAGFTRTKDKTWSGYVEIAKFINKLTGGTEYTAGKVSPTGDEIDYLVGQAFGGVGRELSKAGTTAEALLTGEELPPYKVPLVGRFYGDAKGQAAQSSEFYDNLRMLGKHETEIKGRRADDISTQDYRKENPEATLIAHAKQSDKIVRNLRKLKESKVEAGAPAAEVKAVDEKITRQMQKLNELVRKKKEEAEQ